MTLLQKYISYVRTVRRYSERTVDVYTRVISDFQDFVSDVSGQEQFDDTILLEFLNYQTIRSYEVHMLDSGKYKPRTVNLHISVLSGFCRFLMKDGLLKSNPVRLVHRPKQEKRLPVFYREEDMTDYFERSQESLSEATLKALEFECSKESRNGKALSALYDKLLARVMVSTLYNTGIRRAELIGMNVGDVDFGRNVIKVRGKGDKKREIPMIISLSQEILLYLDAVEMMVGKERSLKEPLFVTSKGKRIYPVIVDRLVKKELGEVAGVTGKKSPHCLRHSLATGLLNQDADLNSIKELLGHSSLAATQVYTHNSISKLKDIYKTAHPRAKNGGNYGD